MPDFANIKESIKCAGDFHMHTSATDGKPQTIRGDWPTRQFQLRAAIHRHNRSQATRSPSPAGLDVENGCCTTVEDIDEPFSGAPSTRALTTPNKGFGMRHPRQPAGWICRMICFGTGRWVSRVFNSRQKQPRDQITGRFPRRESKNPHVTASRTRMAGSQPSANLMTWNMERRMKAAAKQPAKFLGTPMQPGSFGCSRRPISPPRNASAFPIVINTRRAQYRRPGVNADSDFWQHAGPD